MKKMFIFLIKLYQNIPGNFHNCCRHVPSCSNYMIDAINEYGVIHGCFLGMKRIFRCNPWGTFGYDPVKVKEGK